MPPSSPSPHAPRGGTYPWPPWSLKAWSSVILFPPWCPWFPCGLTLPLGWNGGPGRVLPEVPGSKRCRVRHWMGSRRGRAIEPCAGGGIPEVPPFVLTMPKGLWLPSSFGRWGRGGTWGWDIRRRPGCPWRGGPADPRRRLGGSTPPPGRISMAWFHPFVLPDVFSGALLSRGDPMAGPQAGLGCPSGGCWPCGGVLGCP